MKGPQVTLATMHYTDGTHTERQYATPDAPPVDWSL